jgi:anti-sigma-K factor RskA
MNPDVHTLAGAFALDAVDDIERAEFARHLAQCPACAVEVAELRATAARMAGAVATPPPPRLRAEVLRRISQTPQAGPLGGDRARGGGQVRWRRLAAVAAAVAVVAAGAGVTTYAVQEQRVRHARAEAADAGRIAAVLGAADARVLHGTAAGGRLTLVESGSLNEGVAILSGLPDLAADQSYQLWLLAGRQVRPRNVGVLRSGSGRQLLPDLYGAGALALSLERGTAAVDQPSTDVLGSVALR